MHRSPLRTAWTLAAVGAASAVGVLTRDPGFIVITFVGTLVVPRMLGIAGHRHHGPFGHHRHEGWKRGELRPGIEARLDEWHRRAHAQPSGSPAQSDATASA